MVQRRVVILRRLLHNKGRADVENRKRCVCVRSRFIQLSYGVKKVSKKAVRL